MKKDDQYWCDKFHTDREDRACEEYKLSIQLSVQDKLSNQIEKQFLNTQWNLAKEPWKYGCQLAMPFYFTIIKSNLDIQNIGNSIYATMFSKIVKF